MGGISASSSGEAAGPEVNQNEGDGGDAFFLELVTPNELLRSVLRLSRVVDFVGDVEGDFFSNMWIREVILGRFPEDEDEGDGVGVGEAELALDEKELMLSVSPTTSGGRGLN